MFVNIGKTASRHSSNSDDGIGSSARDLGEHFLSRDRSASAVIGLNVLRVEPRKTASQLNGDGELAGVLAIMARPLTEIIPVHVKDLTELLR